MSKDAKAGNSIFLNRPNADADLAGCPWRIVDRRFCRACLLPDRVGQFIERDDQLLSPIDLFKKPRHPRSDNERRSRPDLERHHYRGRSPNLLTKFNWQPKLI